jgi:hypothetical protein
VHIGTTKTKTELLESTHPHPQHRNFIAMKFSTTLFAAASVVAVSCAVPSVFADEGEQPSLRDQVTTLFGDIGDEICQDTASDDVQGLNDSLPLCFQEYGTQINSALGAVQTCQADFETLGGNMTLFGQVLAKGAMAAFTDGSLDNILFKLLSSDVVPSFYNEVAVGCLLNATDPTVLAVGSLLKGSAFTYQEYLVLKQTVLALLTPPAGGNGARRLDGDGDDDESIFAMFEGKLGPCLEGKPKLAYGSPFAAFAFLNQAMSDEKPEDCFLCQMLSQVPMSKENAIDAEIITWLVNNKEDVFALYAVLMDIVPTLIASAKNEGTAAALICAAGKPRYDIVGFGLSATCLTAVGAAETHIWDVVSDLLVAGVPSQCDTMSEYLCGAEEPIFPMYTAATIGSEHAAFAAMLKSWPTANSVSRYTRLMQSICDPVAFPSPTRKPTAYVAGSPSAAPTKGSASAHTLSAAAFAVSVGAMMSAL